MPRLLRQPTLYATKRGNALEICRNTNEKDKNNPFPNDEEGIINHLIIYKKTISCFLLHHDWLVLRNESLHDAPSYEICNGTDAEHHHVGCRFAVETKELECSLRVKCKAVL